MRTSQISKFIVRGALAIFALVLAGCFPYQNDFSCRLKDNYGHCVSMTTAYNASVSGEDPGRPLKKGENAGDGHEAHGGPAKDGDALPSEYVGYRQQMYREMANLIESPSTPMLSPPKQMRTLFLPYAPSSQKNRIFMPRYVYSIVEPPKFVMGEYLYKRPELAPSLMQKTIQIDKSKAE